MVLLGAFCVVTGLAAVDSLVAAMRELVPAYRTEHLAGNEAALRAGAAAAPAPGEQAWETPVAAGGAR
jgi:Pyruvate/2-oxoacid:ferredoxin oxidoreductase gamma subunit